MFAFFVHPDRKNMMNITRFDTLCCWVTGLSDEWH